jgi:hypothetical protein
VLPSSSTRSDLLGTAIGILDPKPRRLSQPDDILDDLEGERAATGTYTTQAPQRFQAGRIRQVRHVQHRRPAGFDIGDTTLLHICQQALCTAVSRQVYRHERAQADQRCRDSGEMVRDLSAKYFGWGLCWVICCELTLQFYDAAF